MDVGLGVGAGVTEILLYANTRTHSQHVCIQLFTHMHKENSATLTEITSIIHSVEVATSMKFLFIEVITSMNIILSK